MQILKIISVLLSFVVLGGCKFSIDVYRANEGYQENVIKKYDQKYIDHFPKKIEYLPVSYGGKIENDHSENRPVIFDYRDSKIDYFEKMFKQPNRYYKKLLK